MDNNFGNFISKMRKEKKMSMRQLAMKCGLSAAYISNLEAGKRYEPSIDTLMKFSAALNIPYEELLMNAGYLRKSDEIYKDLITQFRSAIDESKIIDISNLSQYKFKLNDQILSHQDAELAFQMIQLIVNRSNRATNDEQDQD